MSLSSVFAFNYGWQNDASRVIINPTTIIYNGTNQFITNNVTTYVNTTNNIYYQAVWGNITGNILNQLDLFNVFYTKTEVNNLINSLNVTGINRDSNMNLIIESSTKNVINYDLTQSDEESINLYIKSGDIFVLKGEVN